MQAKISTSVARYRSNAELAEMKVTHQVLVDVADVIGLLLQLGDFNLKLGIFRRFAVCTLPAVEAHLEKIYFRGQGLDASSESSHNAIFCSTEQDGITYSNGNDSPKYYSQVRSLNLHPMRLRGNCICKNSICCLELGWR